MVCHIERRAETVWRDQSAKLSLGPPKKPFAAPVSWPPRQKKEKTTNAKKQARVSMSPFRDVTAGLALKRLHLHMIRQSSRHKKPQETREFWSSLMLSVTSLDAVWGGNWNLREKHRLHVMMDGVTVTAPVGFCQYLLGSLDVGFMSAASSASGPIWNPESPHLDVLVGPRAWLQHLPNHCHSYRPQLADKLKLLQQLW